MATVLDKELKRQITVDGADYVVVVDPEGLRLTGKGKRKPEVELRWRDLLSGEAAMAVALNASLLKKVPPAAKAAKEDKADKRRATPASTEPSAPDKPGKRTTQARRQR
jgi:hypothetical protein